MGLGNGESGRERERASLAPASLFLETCRPKLMETGEREGAQACVAD